MDIERNPTRRKPAARTGGAPDETDHYVPVDEHAHRWDVDEAPTLRDWSRVAQTPALVLVVDDDADHRAMYSEYLVFLGHRVLAASRGDEALRLARLTRPDLVVLDLAMPKLDGVEVARSLRSESRTSDVRILAVTGFGPEWQARARAAGCDVVLQKPTHLPAFEAHVRDLLRRS